MSKLRRTTKNNLITYAVVLAFFIVSFILSETGIAGSQFTGLLVPIGIYIILAVSLNLTVGILGELSLGHAGFMCVGAYVGGVFSVLTLDTLTSVYIRFPLAILIGGIAAGIFGLLIGIPVLRLRGDYLAIVTLGFGEIIKSIANNIYIAKDINGVHFSFAAPVLGLDTDTKLDVLKGAQGISAPQDTNLIVVVIAILVTLFVIMNLVDSKAGRAFMSIRDNYIAAESVGINVTKYRLIAFAISAVFAGVAGVLYSHSLAVVAPKKFDYNLSILILVFVVLGGLGSLRGSIVATIILYALPEMFRNFQNYRMLIYSVVLIAMMIFNNSPQFATLREKLQIKRLINMLKFKGKKPSPEGGAQ